MIFNFFSVPLLSVLRGHSVFPSPPQRPMTDFEGFSIPDFIHYIFFYLNSSERAGIINDKRDIFKDVYDPWKELDWNDETSQVLRNKNGTYSSVSYPITVQGLLHSVLTL